MKLIQLKYFQTACRLNSITQAAEVHHVSQPSISMAIRELEDEFGVQLISHKRKTFELTPEGEVMLEQADRLLHLEDEVTQTMKSLGPNRNLLRLGVPPMVGACLMTAIYSEYQPSHPHVTLTIHENGRRQLLEALDNNGIDLAFLPHNTPITGNYETLTIMESETVCVLPPRHPLASRKVLSVEDLKDQPLVLFQNGHFQTDLITSRFAQIGLTPHVIHESEQLSTIEMFVMRELAAGFIMAPLADLMPQVVSIPLDPPLKMNISMVWRKNSYQFKEMREFIRFISKEATLPDRASSL